MTESKRTPLRGEELSPFAPERRFRLYESAGCHLAIEEERPGARFAVLAPNAASVSVIGSFNAWNPESHPLSGPADGFWSGFVPGVKQGDSYKYHVRSRFNGYRVDKADPFGFRHETPPKTGSIVWDLDFDWTDSEWMAGRHLNNALDSPISIYELHLGSWKREWREQGRSLTYRELAPELADYMKRMGFTHAEFLPVMEHPYGASWGYQVTGYFAPTSRFGTPQDFMHLIDSLHREGIGVILDWVPAHFPSDEHGLVYFDGTHLYEHADPRQGFHPEWKSCVFNYDRDETRGLLGSSARFWLDRYHADGLRVDGVASMLSLDYARKEGEWVANKYGGRENLGAIEFLRDLNDEIHKAFPDTLTIAEDSTSWPMVSRPTYIGGLGFSLKWDLGWMNDTLKYLAFDPVYRKYHHGNLTFRMMYAFNENFVLPLSHDEVVHLKKSLISKMPGDDWQKFATLRLLFGYQFAQPGKKLVFMGGEIAQWREWDHEGAVDWHLLDGAPHRGVQQWMADLNRLYREEPALHELDSRPEGFSWIDCHDADLSVVSFLRRARDRQPAEAHPEPIVSAFNFTPVPRHRYRIGVPSAGLWREALNSDDLKYGGSGIANSAGTEAHAFPVRGFAHSIEVSLPPLGALFLKRAPR